MTILIIYFPLTDCSIISLPVALHLQLDQEQRRLVDTNPRVLLYLLVRRVDADHEAPCVTRRHCQGCQAEVCLHQVLARDLQVYLNSPGDERLEDSRNHHPQIVSHQRFSFKVFYNSSFIFLLTFYLHIALFSSQTKQKTYI